MSAKPPGDLIFDPDECLVLWRALRPTPPPPLPPQPNRQSPQPPRAPVRIGVKQAAPAPTPKKSGQPGQFRGEVLFSLMLSALATSAAAVTRQGTAGPPPKRRTSQQVLLVERTKTMSLKTLTFLPSQRFSMLQQASCRILRSISLSKQGDVVWLSRGDNKVRGSGSFANIPPPGKAPVADVTDFNDEDEVTGGSSASPERKANKVSSPGKAQPARAREPIADDVKSPQDEASDGCKVEACTVLGSDMVVMLRRNGSVEFCHSANATNKSKSSQQYAGSGTSKKPSGWIRLVSSNPNCVIVSLACGGVKLLAVTKDGRVLPLMPNSPPLPLSSLSQSVGIVPGRTVSSAIPSFGSDSYFLLQSRRLLYKHHSHTGSTSTPRRCATAAEISCASASCGYHFVIMVDHYGRLWVSGRNDKGQLGLSVNYSRQVKGYFLHPTFSMSTAVAICNKNTSVQLAQSYIPAPIGPTRETVAKEAAASAESNNIFVTSIPTEVLKQVICASATCGMAHTVVVSVTGKVYATGDNSEGQTGQPAKPEDPYVQPSPDNPGKDFIDEFTLIGGLPLPCVAASGGNASTALVLLDGTIWVCGEGVGFRPTQVVSAVVHIPKVWRMLLIPVWESFGRSQRIEYEDKDFDSDTEIEGYGVPTKKTTSSSCSCCNVQ